MKRTAGHCGPGRKQRSFGCGREAFLSAKPDDIPERPAKPDSEAAPGAADDDQSF